MTVQNEWEECNDRYLNSALSWLRLRLEQLAYANPNQGATAIRSFRFRTLFHEERSGPGIARIHLSAHLR